MKLVGLDSELAPIGKTLAQHTTKPLHLTCRMKRLLLEQKHMQTGGTSLTRKCMGLRGQARHVGALPSTRRPALEPLIPPESRERWGRHIWGGFCSAAPFVQEL